MNAALPRFIDLKRERQLDILVAELRTWRSGGRKSWTEARQFLLRAQVLSIELGVQLPEVIDMIDVAASA